MPKWFRRLFTKKGHEKIPELVERIYRESRGTVAPNSGAMFALSDMLVERALNPGAEGLKRGKKLSRERTWLMYFVGERTVKGGKLSLKSIAMLSGQILELLPGYIERNGAKINPLFRKSLAQLEAELPADYLRINASLSKNPGRENEPMQVSDGIIHVAQILNDEAMQHAIGNENFE